MKKYTFQKIFFNFFMFGWLKYYEKYFPTTLIFLQFEENDLPTQSRKIDFKILFQPFPLPVSPQSTPQPPQAPISRPTTLHPNLTTTHLHPDTPRPHSNPMPMPTSSHLRPPFPRLVQPLPFIPDQPTHVTPPPFCKAP